MPANPIDQVSLGGTIAHDLSIISLFMQADLIVKIVLFLLLVASFWSWAVIFDKFMRLRRLSRDAESFEESFWCGGSLDDLVTMTVFVTDIRYGDELLCGCAARSLDVTSRPAH